MWSKEGIEIYWLKILYHQLRWLGCHPYGLLMLLQKDCTVSRKMGLFEKIFSFTKESYEMLSSLGNQKKIQLNF